MRTAVCLIIQATFTLSIIDTALATHVPRSRSGSGEVNGPYYGMPLVNWVGWLVTGLVIATGFDALGFDRHARHSPLAVKVWILNGIFPIGICAVRGLTGAAVVGSVAIMLPIVLSMRRQPDVARASA